MTAEEFIELGREWAEAHRVALGTVGPGMKLQDPDKAREAVRKRSQLERKLDACPFAFDYQVRRQFLELKPLKRHEQNRSKNNR